MDNEAEREEYVLNQYGRIWIGSRRNHYGRRWFFGQVKFTRLICTVLNKTWKCI